MIAGVKNLWRKSKKDGKGLHKDLNSFDHPPYSLKSTSIVSLNKFLNPIISKFYPTFLLNSDANSSLDDQV
jgi:hypothetical protein